MTKSEATKRGKALLKRLIGTGWKLEVWGNQGWHYQCCLEQLTVFPCGSEGEWFTLLGESPGRGGSVLWDLGRAYKDPNIAVRAQLRRARKTINNLDSNLRNIEKAIGVE